MNDIAFFQSKNIKDYKAILTGLEGDFEQEHWSYILTWCDIIDRSPEDFGKYWKVWLIETQGKIVGICGIYSLNHKDNVEMWLGWFGVLPEYRGNKIGETAIEYMQVEAIKAGAKILKSYIDTGEQPLKFYQKNGFEWDGYLDNGRDYWVITKKL